MRPFKSLILSVLFVPVMAVSTTTWAAPVTIDFGGSPLGLLTGTTTEDGFNYDLFSGLIAVTSPGNPAPDLSAFGSPPVGVLRIVSTTLGELFNFDGLDFAEFLTGGTPPAGGTDIVVEGFLMGASQGSQTFTPLASVGGLGLYSTGLAMGALLNTDIDELRVRINGASGFPPFSKTGRVDNIVLDKMVQPIPVPSAMLLFGSGLAGLVGWRWWNIKTA